MKITRLFSEFFNSEKTSGFVLFACTLFSLVLTNSSFGHGYLQLWNIQLAGHAVTHWINDGLMTIFFLLVGLEIEREIYIGELRNVRNTMLPVFAAIGGMLVPALIHFLLNRNTPQQSGFGIPMATDIAFALGVLSLAGKRVPIALKIFLTALAIIDDLGAIMIIAIFYTSQLSLQNLIISLSIFAVLVIMNRMKINSLVLYIVPGIAMWYFMLHSGLHPTITGVLLAFAIPFRKGGDDSPSAILQHFLHKPVAFGILPLFALANTCIYFEPGIFSKLTEHNSLGIMLGLLVGKPAGIILFCLVARWLGIAKMPPGISFKHIMGAGILAGIGFTMSVFITLLAFHDDQLIAVSKISILLTSLLAALTGLLVLSVVKPAGVTAAGE
jgi:NhaA family Na+:H+ antiporter